MLARRQDHVLHGQLGGEVDNPNLLHTVKIRVRGYQRDIGEGTGSDKTGQAWLNVHLTTPEDLDQPLCSK